MCVATCREVDFGSIYFQARIAAEAGAIGLILYTDPSDVSLEGAGNTFPNSWWLPPSGIQRGTLLNFEQGDPLTPGYPARSGLHLLLDWVLQIGFKLTI